MSDVKKYNEIFEYLSNPLPPPKDEEIGVLVFGRHDTRLVDAMKRLRRQRKVPFFVPSGALGKDSGYLHTLSIAEATFLASVATAQPDPIPAEMIYPEMNAKHGGDNARLGMEVMDRHGLVRTALIALAHAISLRRLAATLEFEGGKITPVTNKVYRVPTNYPFDPTSRKDQYEGAAELDRLAKWPQQGMLGPQDDLPLHLIEFAEYTKKKLEDEGDHMAFASPSAKK